MAELQIKRAPDQLQARTESGIHERLGLLSALIFK